MSSILHNFPFSEGVSHTFDLESQRNSLTSDERECRDSLATLNDEDNYSFNTLLLDQESKLTNNKNQQIASNKRRPRRCYNFIKTCNHTSIFILIVLSSSLIFLYVKLLHLTGQMNDQFLDGHYSISSLTKDVTVKPIHSHNDEWRKHPLFDALRIGSNSIEADCYFLESNPNLIYVGHKRPTLTNDKSLQIMYLNPLYNLLEEANIDNYDNHDLQSKNGIFYNNPENTTYLYIDIKKNPVELVKLLESHLEKFIEKNYLTYFDTKTDSFIEGPLTIIITGDFPYNYISQMEKRYMFIDAPLHLLTDPAELAKYPSKNISLFTSSSLNKLIDPYYSNLNFFNGLNKGQMKTLNNFIDVAHGANLRTRIWDTPKFTKSLKFKIWKQLLQLGSDYLNVDQLCDAAKF